MLELGRYWWLILLRGLAAVLFGSLFLAWPAASLAALVLLFGAWALADGGVALAAAISGRRGTGATIEGMFGLAIGAVVLTLPGATAFVLYALIAAWAVVTGVLKLFAGVRLRRDVRGEIWLGLSGAASIAFGALMLALPAAGVVGIGWLIGVYALALGALLIALAFRVRTLATRAPI